MTVEKILGDNENCDNFPVGLRVLAVDDDPTCLMFLESLLRKCQYHVTATSQARMALKMLREDRDRFDLVISDVHMPDMDGFKLLELVGLEMDLPVIMLSANGDPKLVMKGVTHGACDYLVKPVRIEELRNIWQHVIRRKRSEPKNQKISDDQGKAHQVSGESHGPPVTCNEDQNGKFNRKRKDDDNEIEDNGSESEDPATQKRPRVVWSIELHRKFVAAVNQLGIEKAVPKRILDLMNVEGLTRENVASHLQKYRLYLKRISSVATQQANMAAALGVKDSPFMRMGSFESLGGFRTLVGRPANVALSPYTTGGLLGRLNSPASINIRNLTHSTLLQPIQAQNTSNSINAFGKMHPVLDNQNPSIYQGIPSSLELDQLQQNKCPTGVVNFNGVDDSRLFTATDSLIDPGAAFGSSSNMLNSLPSYPLLLHGNSQQPQCGGGFMDQPAHNLGSFNSESLNCSSNLLDPGTTESSPVLPTLVLTPEPFHSQLPVNSGRENYSPNVPYLQSNHIIISSTAMALPLENSRGREGLVSNGQHTNQAANGRWREQTQNYGHSSKATFCSIDSFVQTNGCVSTSNQDLDHDTGIFNQKTGMFADGRSAGGASTFTQQSENEKLAAESGARSNDNFLLGQRNLQNASVPHSSDPLDDMLSAMIKREQHDTIPTSEFGFDDYLFGSCV